MIKKAIILGRKNGSVQALHWLLKQGVNIPLLIADPQEKHPRLNLYATAKAMGIAAHANDQILYEMIDKKDSALKDVDLIISYLHNKKIKKSLFQLGTKGCINFHPAPLPDYKSSAGYNTAILDQRNSFGVSAHFIDSEQFDSGPIIKVNRFSIDHTKETALSLERKTQEKLFELFKEVMADFLEEKPIATLANSGGTYWTKKDLELLRTINAENDTLEEINRKIRAFFFPPYHGATISIKGQQFTLINKEILEYIATLIYKA